MSKETKMQTDTARRLGEIARIEETLADLVTASIPRVESTELKNRMRRVAARHRKHNEALLGMAEVERPTSGAAEDERAVLHRRVQHAEDTESLMATLGHLEQEQSARLQEVIDEHPESEVARLIREEKQDLDEDVRVFLDMSAGLEPDVGEPRETV
jgi:hypothetical protein